MSRGRHSRRAFALLFLAVVAGVASRADELDADEVTGRLQNWLDGTRDLEGRFEQVLASGALGTGTEESGRFYLRRPGRMRWDYMDPERKVALVHGKATSLYIEEDRQLWEGTLDDEALLAALLAGSEPVEAAFSSELLAPPTEGGAYRLRLVPRDDVESFSHVILTVRAPDFAIHAAEVLDGAGNRMLYRFGDLRRNSGLSDETFHFEPPLGTELVRP